tara:strand:- start:225 stop:776 length:552 start_codon:yes stop_codon:yes gene_type:complete
MKKVFTILIVGLTLLSCAQTKEIGSQDVPTPPVAPTDVQKDKKQGNGIFTLTDVSKNDSLFASITKGYCYGTCPVYKLKIYNSGHVSLEGIKNIDQIGFFSARINQEKMDTFSDMAKQIDYMNLSDEYDNRYVSDLPETNTSIVIDGKRKTVRKRYDYPRSILAFEKLFIKLLEELAWEKVQE